MTFLVPAAVAVLGYLFFREAPEVLPLDVRQMLFDAEMSDQWAPKVAAAIALKKGGYPQTARRFLDMANRDRAKLGMPPYIIEGI